MDILAEDDDMAERIGDSEECRRVRDFVDSALSEREARIIRLRYGLDGSPPLTQRGNRGALPHLAELCIPH